MKPVYRVMRRRSVTASQADSSSAGCGDRANFEDVAIETTETVGDCQSLDVAEAAIEADIRARDKEVYGLFGRIGQLWDYPEELARVRGEYMVIQCWIMG